MQMDCPTEEALLRKKLSGMPGVAGMEFNLMQRVLTVTHEPVHKPIYKKGWFWGVVVGSVVVVAGVGAGLGIGLTRGNGAPSTDVGNQKVFLLGGAK